MPDFVPQDQCQNTRHKLKEDVTKIVADFEQQIDKKAETTTVISLFLGILTIAAGAYGAAWLLFDSLKDDIQYTENKVEVYQSKTYETLSKISNSVAVIEERTYNMKEKIDRLESVN